MIGEVTPGEHADPHGPEIAGSDEGDRREGFLVCGRPPLEPDADDPGTGSAEWRQRDGSGGRNTGNPLQLPAQIAEEVRKVA